MLSYVVLISLRIVKLCLANTTHKTFVLKKNDKVYNYSSFIHLLQHLSHLQLFVDHIILFPQFSKCINNQTCA